MHYYKKAFQKAKPLSDDFRNNMRFAENILLITKLKDLNNN